MTVSLVSCRKHRNRDTPQRTGSDRRPSCADECRRLSPKSERTRHVVMLQEPLPIRRTLPSLDGAQQTNTLTDDAAPVADPERLVAAIRPLARSGRLQAARSVLSLG